jgi:hypothetical protein
MTTMKDIQNDELSRDEMEYDGPQQRAHDIDVAKRKVVLHSIDMPFWALVRFLIKLSLAAIPAFIILAIPLILILLLLLIFYPGIL